MNKKSIILAISFILLFVVTVGTTVAYLQTSTDPVTNVFVGADLGDMTLDESKPDELDESDGTNDYLVVPGQDITKNPMVTYTVDTTTEDNPVPVYVFVKMDAAGWTASADNMAFSQQIGDCADALSFGINSAWTYLTTESGSYVYYIALDAGVNLTNQEIINGNNITVSADITEEDLDDATAANAVAMAGADLTFKAYAIQQNTLTAAQAWAAL